MKEALVIWYGDPDTAQAVVRRMEQNYGRASVNLADVKADYESCCDEEVRRAKAVKHWKYRMWASRSHAPLKTIKDYSYWYFLWCTWMLVFIGLRAVGKCVLDWLCWFCEKYLVVRE